MEGGLTQGSHRRNAARQARAQIDHARGCPPQGLDKICGEGIAVNDQELAEELYATEAPLTSGDGAVVVGDQLGRL
jgi:hypothetical protein